MKKLLLTLLFLTLIASPCWAKQIINKESMAIREKYKIEHQELDEAYKKDKVDKKEYRIGRRRIVLLRQKELLEKKFLDNDIDPETSISELEWINEELAGGVKDKELVCPHDPYPHNTYPTK